MFGQLRPPGSLPDGLTAAQRTARERLPVAEPKRLRDLADLLKWLSEHLANAAVVRRTQQPWAETAARFIADHLARPITTEGLARVLGRSPSFITHRFRAEFGMPLHRYVMRARLARARDRLAAGASVRQLAGELGFCDEFHLSRAFRAHWGRPPSAFKPA
jgi:AraC-like DNA-binding protein